MSKPRLIYLPLGGAGEIGMNAYVYGYGPENEERLILVDAGVTFPSMDSSPGVDLIFADMAWLAERADRIEAIFITHAHEDHVGALGLVHGILRAPIHARAFTAANAERKLEERGQDTTKLRVAAPWPETVTAGPFKVGFLPIAHSIPESSALVIDTPAGRILHTGDFKTDPTPMVGEPHDPDLWRRAAGKDLKALVCDSTNVFSPNPGRSEAALEEPITALIASATGLVAATTFASNVARLRTLARAAQAAGRSVCLLGRAMRRMVETSVETGVLTDFPTVVSPEDALEMPRGNVLLLTTGSQGERRAATAGLANGKYLGFEMREGDMMLFSSKTIPGNEVSVGRIVNQFSEKGVDIVDESAGFFHVSGHANRPDLESVHTLTDPKMVIPMHGEHRHLREHARLAEAAGRASVIAPNGTMVDLTGDTPRIVEHIEAGRVYLDGNRQIGALDGVVRDRIRMALNGHVGVTVIIDENDDAMPDAWVMVRGLASTDEGEDTLEEQLEDAAARVLATAGRKTIMDDEALETQIKRSVRREAEAVIGKKPEVTVTISRLVSV